ncbi:tyrosine-protein phosphatase [Pediococcus pentosaceus]|uniref:tyrosine-protein phosphatase n=1 Tax=Pediococcus pentosaceus TaxID=1255 RepID=UPI0039781DB6
MKPERILNVPGAVNFRELGGYQTKFNQTIKWQKLLRSGELSHLTPRTQALLADYGLKYDIDLRSPAEASWSSDKIPAQTIYRFYPVYPIQDNEKSDLPQNKHLKYQAYEQSLYDPYLTMAFSEHSRIAFHQMFVDLLANTNEKESLLFHCAAGKDRTGMAGMLILSALQVPYQTIREDYLLTNLVYSNQDPDELRRQITGKHVDKLIQKMNSVFSVTDSSLDHTHDLILDRFGSFDHYFKEALEFSDQDLADLRQIYLE